MNQSNRYQEGAIVRVLGTPESLNLIDTDSAIFGGRKGKRSVKMAFAPISALSILPNDKPANEEIQPSFHSALTEEIPEITPELSRKILQKVRSFSKFDQPKN